MQDTAKAISPKKNSRSGTSKIKHSATSAQLNAHENKTLVWTGCKSRVPQLEPNGVTQSESPSRTTANLWTPGADHPPPLFFFEGAQLDMLRSECRKACIEQFMLKMSADGAYRRRPARGSVTKNRTRKLPSACMNAFAAKSRSSDASFAKNQHCISRLSELARDLDRKPSTKQDAVVIDLGHLTASGCAANPESISKISRSFLSGCGWSPSPKANFSIGIENTARNRERSARAGAP